MTTTSRLSPVILGYVVAALLMVIIVAVVAKTVQDASGIEGVAAAGIDAVQLSESIGNSALPVANSVAAALPQFQLAVAVATPWYINATYVDVDERYLAWPLAHGSPNPVWMESLVDPAGNMWVWANDWYFCNAIDADALTYFPVAEFNQQALVAWNQLSVNRQSDVTSRCDNE